MWIALILAIIALFLVGPCWFCKRFAVGGVEDNSPHDVEHDAAGKPLTGLRRYISQRAEAIFTPLCHPFNKLFGRLK